MTAVFEKRPSPIRRKTGHLTRGKIGHLADSLKESLCYSNQYACERVPRAAGQQLASEQISEKRQGGQTVERGGIVLRADNKATRLLSRLSQNPLARELAPLVGLYWVYTLVRWFVALDSPYNAYANAFKVIQLERQIGVFFEPVIQKAAINHAQGIVHFANIFYTAGYFPVLVLTGVSLYLFERDRFHTFKLAFLLGLGFALIGFSLFPLAPPRLLPGMGFVDTQQVFGSGLYNDKTVASLYNPYAAMPSMHFGWALLVGIVAFSSGRRILKVAGVFYPICMAFVIITTGHHYFLDIAGGAAVVGMAYCLVRAFSRGFGKLVPVPIGDGMRLAEAQSHRNTKQRRT
jgi:hypothetical protein